MIFFGNSCILAVGSLKCSTYASKDHGWSSYLLQHGSNGRWLQHGLNLVLTTSLSLPLPFLASPSNKNEKYSISMFKYIESKKCSS